MDASNSTQLTVISHRKQDNGYNRVLLVDQNSNELYYALTSRNAKQLRSDWPWTWDYPPRLIDKYRVVPVCIPELTQIQLSYTLFDEYHGHFYIKRPDYLAHGENLIVGYTPVNDMSREISICEYLRQYPHPNVCAYHGVLPDAENFVSGLVFDRYDMNLFEYVRQHHHFDARKALNDIEAGIDHLHLLGLIHCDIKPENIFVDMTNQRFVVGDFDSTHRRGERITGKCGTAGWTDERFREAQREVDFHGLGMLRFWLENKGFGAPMESESYMRADDILAAAKYLGDT